MRRRNERGKMKKKKNKVQKRSYKKGVSICVNQLTLEGKGTSVQSAPLNDNGDSLRGEIAESYMT